MKHTVRMLISLWAVAIMSGNSTSDAQPSADPVLMTISGKDVYLSEFRSVFLKNTKKDSLKSEKEIQEYLDLFANYKLKVKEARTIGMDTTAAFRNELSGYRSQLTKPYLTDKPTEERLLQEAYNRKRKDLKVSHLLVKVPLDAGPQDTALAYKRIMQLRSRIAKGEPFDKVSAEASEIASAKTDKGNLGWFTAFRMEYPFESTAYANKTGQVSMPVRTQLGYHLIMVTGEREAMGQMRAGHILITINGKSKEDSLKAKKVIDDLYEKLKGGAKFEELARQSSHDKSTGMKGGELPAFKTGDMVDIFDETAYALKKDGDFSDPFLTEYGWHIVKRIERKPVPAFEEIKDDLKSQLQKDSRYRQVRAVMAQKIKKEYGFRENSKALTSAMTMVDDTYFDGKWKKPSSPSGEFLFSIGDQKYSTGDFMAFVEKNQKKRPKTSLTHIINDLYAKYVEEMCIQYEDKNLEKKYPDFASLMKEYSDGILLFELTDKKVWSRAIKDTVGLAKFYEENKKSYMWDERADVTVFKCASDEAAAKTRKLVEKQLKKGLNTTEILKQVNTDTLHKKLEIEEVRYQKNENEDLSKVEWKEGLSVNILNDGKVLFYNVKKILKPEPKSLREARGIVTTDFQNFLEREWMDELRKKYPVVISKDAVSVIKAIKD